MPGPVPEAVQRGCNVFLLPASCHRVHQFHRFRRGLAAVLSGFGQTRAHLRVSTAVPMDGEHGLASGILHIGDNLCDQRADDSLLDVHVCVLRVPDGVEFAREGVEPFRSGERDRDFNLIPPQFDAQEVDAGQRLVPPQLVLARNQPIVRIHGLEAARGQIDLVFRVLKRLAFGMERLSPLGLDKCPGRCRRGDGMRLNDCQRLLGDRHVRPQRQSQCSEGDRDCDAPSCTCDGDSWRSGRDTPQPAAAHTRTPQQPRQRRAATTR